MCGQTRPTRCVLTTGVACATATPEISNKMHINRLSKDNDTYDLIRAFDSDERDEALDFIES